jgi:hypothetical protein
VLFGLKYLNITTIFSFGRVDGEARGVNIDTTTEYLTAE